MLGFHFSQYVAPTDNRTPFERLFDLFLELLVHTSGDVEEALDWMGEIDREHILPHPNIHLKTLKRPPKECFY